MIHHPLFVYNMAAAVADVGGVEESVNEDEILLEAGSDPSLLRLQGQTAPIELLAEVHAALICIFWYIIII